MDFEQVMKRQRGLEPVDTAVAQATLTALPVIGNTSGVREGEVINEIFGHEVRVPVINGEKRAATVILKCGVIVDGALVPRIVFLSTLIRKIDLNSKFTGMIAEDAAFNDHENFTNEDWVKAFTSAAPFMIETINAKDREIRVRNNAGEQVMETINVKECLLKKLSKADAGKMIVAGATPDAGATPKKKRS